MSAKLNIFVIVVVLAVVIGRMSMFIVDEREHALKLQLSDLAFNAIEVSGDRAQNFIVLFLDGHFQHTGVVLKRLRNPLQRADDVFELRAFTAQ